MIIFAKESANIDSLLSKSLTINEKDNGQSILSSQNAKIVKDPEEYFEGDNPPIGIILTCQKDELLMEFTTYGMSSQLFVSKYQLYLPNEEELRAELESILSQEGDSEK